MSAVARRGRSGGTNTAEQRTGPAPIVYVCHRSPCHGENSVPFVNSLLLCLLVLEVSAHVLTKKKCALLALATAHSSCRSITNTKGFAELVLEREGTGSDAASFSMPEILSALRRVCLSRAAVPVLCGASLRGIGVEPLLDSVSTFLPSPLDRPRPTGIIRVSKGGAGKGAGGGGGKKRARRGGVGGGGGGGEGARDARGGAERGVGGGEPGAAFTVDPLQNDLVAFVFKVGRFFWPCEGGGA